MRQEVKKFYLVTGAAGFYWPFFTKKLLDQGCHVIGIDNINDYYDVSLKYACLKCSTVLNCLPLLREISLIKINQ